MTILAKARSADRAGEIVSAASLYEQALEAGEQSLPVLLDLALLYWQATDPGIAAAMHLDAAFLDLASHRTSELLEQAARMYPEDTAPRFWMRYIAWADLCEPFPTEECRQLLLENPIVLVPVLHLFAQSQGMDLRVEANELLRQAREHGTMGARYVASVIEAVMRQSARG